ncbi:MAG: methyltransferase domain-containing protein [Verrucomicrobia bacterium]|nr:methyltransferase domain-containing protein [Verrucomicrobiota bacterium]
MSIYAEPRRVLDLNDCYFYHTIDLPRLGRIDGSWYLHDLRSYLGGVDFEGNRVLDVGCAGGALSFYMEQQGAEIVSFDLDECGSWDMVPFAKWADFEHISEERKAIIRRLNNAYWFAHGLFNSKAQVVYGNVYAIPGAIGPVDIVVYGSILIHLRDPFLALQSGLRLAKHTAIITEPLRAQGQAATEPVLGFLPDSTTVEPKDAWWDVRPGWAMRALGVLGFEDVQVKYHTQMYNGKIEQLYTVVGKRTHGHVVP